MDKYTLDKIEAAERLLNERKKAKQSNLTMTQTIPITEKGSFILGYQGAGVEKAILRASGRVISVIVPDKNLRREINGERRDQMIMLNFLGEGKRLHTCLGSYSASVEFHFKEDMGVPSLVQGCGAEPSLIDGEYVEDVTVCNLEGVPINVEIVYRENEVGLRQKKRV